MTTSHPSHRPKRILIYRHPHCAKCARFARLHHVFDLFNRIADTTATPPGGALRPGEIVVEDLASGRLARGAEAFDLICRQSPLYAPFRLLTKVPPVRRRIDRDLRGGVAWERRPALTNAASTPTYFRE